MAKASAPYHFQGFPRPNYTQVPDALFDELLPHLSGAELKVLLYILRRTFGFYKESDNISLSQICGGITTRDGRILDKGTGLSRSTAQLAIAGLIEKNVIAATANVSSQKGFEATTYSPNFQPPYADFRHRAVPKIEQALGRKSVTQETVVQETAQQQTDPSNIRKAPTGRRSQVHDEARQLILEYVEDLSRELGDGASLKSSTTRAVNLYRKSGLALDAFAQKLLNARSITKERTASIKGDGTGQKRRMAYLFACLEDLLEAGASGQAGRES